MKIAIIGIGHIGRAITHGLFKGDINPKSVVLASPDIKKIDALKTQYRVKITKSNKVAVKNANVLIISVKPNIVKDVIYEIKPLISSNTIVISIAACVTLELINKYLQQSKSKIIRIMPNIPVEHGLGVIGVLTNENVTDRDKKVIEKLLSPLGILIECRDDEDIDRLSMISGSGPAYVAYFMCMLEKAARKYGFSKNDASIISRQTFIGSLYHITTRNIEAKDLVEAVATKGGITEEVISCIDESHVQKIFEKGLKKGKAKIIKITKKLNES